MLHSCWTALLILLAFVVGSCGTTSEEASHDLGKSSAPLSLLCTTNGQCNDGDPCTTDACVLAACVNTSLLGCCNEDTDCDQELVCATSSCLLNECIEVPIVGCDGETDDSSSDTDGTNDNVNIGGNGGTGGDTATETTSVASAGASSGGVTGDDDDDDSVVVDDSSGDSVVVNDDDDVIVDDDDDVVVDDDVASDPTKTTEPAPTTASEPEPTGEMADPLIATDNPEPEITLLSDDAEPEPSAGVESNASDVVNTNSLPNREDCDASDDCGDAVTISSELTGGACSLSSSNRQGGFMGLSPALLSLPAFLSLPALPSSSATRATPTATPDRLMLSWSRLESGSTAAWGASLHPPFSPHFSRCS